MDTWTRLRAPAFLNLAAVLQMWRLVGTALGPDLSEHSWLHFLKGFAAKSRCPGSGNDSRPQSQFTLCSC